MTPEYHVQHNCHDCSFPLVFLNVQNIYITPLKGNKPNFKTYFLYLWEVWGNFLYLNFSPVFLKKNFLMLKCRTEKGDNCFLELNPLTSGWSSPSVRPLLRLNRVLYYTLLFPSCLHKACYKWFPSLISIDKWLKRGRGRSHMENRVKAGRLHVFGRTLEKIRQWL